jgi:cytochrome P450
VTTEANVDSIDLFSPDFEASPHEALAGWRREEPVRPVVMPDGRPAWLVTRYDDVRQLLNDHRLTKDGLVPPTGDSGILPPQVQAAISSHMLGADPPAHSRLRELVSSAFTPARVESLRPRVQAIVDSLLDAIADRDEVDLVEDLSFPLPIQVICELLGIPVTDRENFRTWSNIIMVGAGTSAAVDREKLPGAMAALLGYVHQMIASKRAVPGDDLVSALVLAGEEGNRLTANELSSTVFLLLIAGYETSVSMLANVVYTLLTQGGAWKRLREEPTLLSAAIDECLRFESPIETATYRRTTEEIAIGDRVIPAGVPVLLSLLSANRDEARYPKADQFDITRGDTNVAFGHGVHRCLGAPLAAVEAEVVVSSLLLRFPDVKLAVTPDQLAWRRGIFIHGLVSLPVSLR